MDGTLSASKERIWTGYQDVVRRRRGRFAHDIASRVQLKATRAERKNGAVVSTTVVCEAVVEQGAHECPGTVCSVLTRPQICSTAAGACTARVLRIS